ncbi:MAG: nucleotidyltransferase [Brevinematales bacterium]|nr:nucleotidyltransferase [Brevinematales bacterium]
MNEIVMQNLKALKEKYLPEGFIIIGVFGSFAKGNETEKSDIDILYELDERFLSRYIGLDAYVRIDKIRLDIRRKLHKQIDLVNKNSLRRTGKKFILPETLYV